MIFIALGVSAAAGRTAYADSAPTSETVYASVVPSCIVGNATLNFGTYSAISASDSTTTIAVTCNYGTEVSVALDDGLHGDKAPGYGTRALASGDHYLGYDIYRNAAHTIVWNRTHTQRFVSRGRTEELTVYGRIPAGQSKAYAGYYTDTVNIIVTF